MNKLIYIFLFSILFQSCQENVDLSLYNELNNVLSKRHQYEHSKRNYIDSLTYILNNSEGTGKDRYLILQDLHEAYFSFKYDSAIYYANKMQVLAQEQDDLFILNNTKIKIASTLLRAGMLVEVNDILGSISEKQLPKQLLVNYYYTKSILFFDLHDKHAGSIFAQKYWDIGLSCLKKAIEHCPLHSINYYSFSGLYALKTGDLALAAAHYDALFKNYTLTGRQLAVDASTYASVFKELGYDQKTLEWQLKAAIQDIKLVNRENTALKNIGSQLFVEGHINLASHYLDIAFNDAMLYGAKLRQEQVVQILPSVEAAKAKVIEYQKTRIQRYAILSSVLTLLIIGVLIMLFKQLRKVNEAKSVILDQNSAIKENIKRLREENLIKEEYIGFSFKTSSDLIQKLDEVRQDLENKLRSKKYEELKKVLNRGMVKKERDSFFESFDKTFLSIFPEFVVEFNKLFTNENKFIDDTSKALNIELRIFALIRLGICDSERISQILDYSINTINTYKTKVKKRSKVNNDRFEEAIKQIESI